MEGKRTFSADWLFTLDGAPIRNGSVTVAADGTVLEIGETDQPEHRGLICPGFINAHCHLELSHMKGHIPSGTGLPGFLKAVTEDRAFPDEEISQAALKADAEMKQNGIVACGDISNTLDSLPFKQQSELRYFTFVERFGINPAMAAQITEDGAAMTEKYRAADQPASLNLHATYSISTELIREITQWPGNQGFPQTIHMQEHADEDALYLDGTGAFREFLDRIGAQPGSGPWPSGQTALRTLYPLINNGNRLLLVHNTNTSRAEIEELSGANTYWCLCPNANRYIENRTPDLAKFQGVKDRVMLGTDSLASNWQLSILEEMKELSDQAKTADLLKMACSNPADYFDWQDLGRIRKGAKPGLNLLQGTNIQEVVSRDATVSPLLNTI